MLKQSPKFNQTISEYFGRRSKTGEIGIEVEVEGRNFPKDLESWWVVHNDNSLRRLKSGDDSAEYVLRQPIARKSVREALEFLKVSLTDSTVYDSYRTSVHVHLNFSRHTAVQAINMAVLWTILEDALVRWCGPSREGNLFCLRARDAEGIIDNLCSAIEQSNLGLIGEDQRYSALNLNALQKFGSIEVRSLNGTIDIDRIEKWVNVLLKIKDAATERFKTPVQIVEQFSMMGAVEFTHAIVGTENFQEFFDPMPPMWENVRLAQEVAYCVEWDLEAKPEPFVKTKAPMWNSPPPAQVPRNYPIHSVMTYDQAAAETARGLPVEQLPGGTVNQWRYRT